MLQPCNPQIVKKAYAEACSWRKTPPLQIEEISGDKYADLKTAQSAALSPLSANIQSVIRELIERGVLKNDNGKIIPITKEKTQ